MTSIVATKYADILYQMSQKDQGPFPYEDCRRILHEADNRIYDDLIPDLDTYFYEIYSHSMGAKNLIAWSSDELTRSRNIFHRSFFGKHPKYAPLKSMINQDNTPALAQRMSLYDQMRLSLLKLISILIQDQELTNISRQRKLLEAHH